METVEVDTTRKLAKLSKCAHDECTCTVTSGEQFCSDYCASHAESEEAGKGGCECGHTECTATAAASEAVIPPVIGKA